MFLRLGKAADIVSHPGIRMADIVHQDKTDIASDETGIYITDYLPPCLEITDKRHRPVTPDIPVVISRHHEARVRQ